MDRAAQLRSVKRVLAVVLVLNVAVSVAKLTVGWLIHSLSMVADGFHSLTDGASNVVGLIAISIAGRPPDEDHPYGHQKFETLAALIIGGFLALTAWEILRSCVERFADGGAPEVGPVSLAVVGATILVNLTVSIYERRRGEELRSEFLRADASHTRSDVYVSLGVIASLLAARWGCPQFDVVAALVITFMIARLAVEIVLRSAGPLVDAAVVPATEIRRMALSVEGVEGVHKIRTRGHPEHLQGDLHVQVAPELSIAEAHELGHRVSDRLRDEFGFRDVVAHVEPARTGPRNAGLSSRKESPVDRPR